MNDETIEISSTDAEDKTPINVVGMYKRAALMWLYDNGSLSCLAVHELMQKVKDMRHVL